jgi:hypothetical protein
MAGVAAAYVSFFAGCVDAAMPVVRIVSPLVAFACFSHAGFFGFSSAAASAHVAA